MRVHTALGWGGGGGGMRMVSHETSVQWQSNFVVEDSFIKYTVLKIFLLL